MNSLKPTMVPQHPTTLFYHKGPQSLNKIKAPPTQVSCFYKQLG